MTDTAGALRASLDAGVQSIRSRHKDGASGFATAVALTALMDQAIRAAFRALFPTDETSTLAVLAIGGYGRAELYPRSDVDIMVLCPSGEERDEARHGAKSFLHDLWDAGVDIGHSVRTVEEALELHGNAFDAWTSLLESRVVCGRRDLADELSARLRDRIASGPDKWFLDSVLGDVQKRHRRYGSSVKLLEPNIKKSAGGLRDVHTVFWLYRASDPVYFFPLDGSIPASAQFLHVLRENGEVTEEECANITEALAFLCRVRHEMHFQRDAADDSLAYALQHHVADALGFGHEAELHSVEVFMREYYRQARRVHDAQRRLTIRFRELIEPSRVGTSTGGTFYGRFYADETTLSLDPTVRELHDPLEMFEVFVIAAEQGLDLEFRLSGAVERSLHRLTEDSSNSPALAAKFRRILRSHNVGRVLRAMNDLGVLGRYIPEFGELVAFFQHNVYHYYTADEHTIIAIANAERLREQQGALREVFRLLPRKDLLYMAILLHDVAKPRGVADHEITGVDIARTVLHRLGMDEFFADVAFLIRNHLVMEQTAFRRNIHDPTTLKEFAARFQHPAQLDYLYILTYADLSAVNVNVWTEWKAAVLQELYHRTAEILRRNLRGMEIDRFHEEQRQIRLESLVQTLQADLAVEEVQRHLQGMQNDSYMAIFTSEEIAQHIRASRTAETVVTLFSHAEGYTEVTVIARDAPFALSHFCGVLSANDANIFDANVFTRTDGVIIDRFRVSSASSGRQIEQRVCAKIAAEMIQVQNGNIDIEMLFHEHHRKWKRRAKASVNPHITTDVRFEDTPTYTIIDVFAPDSVGFLYRVTRTISQLGLDIYFAKIATRVDGIVDAFYVLDRSGKPVPEAGEQERIRATLLHTIKSVRELVPE